MGRDLSTLRFLSLSHLTFSHEEPEAEPVEIAYYVRAGEGEILLALYRSDTPVGLGKPDTDEGGVLLCDGFSAISFTYYDSEGESHETWNAEGVEAKGKLPSRVSISLEFRDPGSPAPYRFLTGVSIPMGG